MVRKIHKLTARQVATLKDVGRHGDGGGLYLSISAVGGRRWVFLYRRAGRLREMGLGSARDVSLAQARDLAATQRQVLSAGDDPLALKAAAPTEVITFAEAARKLIASKQAGWRNEKHASQWLTTLETYAFPTIGKLPVGQVNTGHVMAILEPIWATKTETASRVRGRMENVLDWAKARGHREGENPARWRGHLDMMLPKRSKVRRVQHHPALPYPKVGDFMRDLRKRDGVAALALEFTILTCARTNEIIGAEPDEINREAEVWTVPAERMKAEREHRIPLSRQALDVLDRAAEIADGGDWLFPNEDDGSTLSNNAMLALLARMGRDDITVHGFRSTFRDWAAEMTSFPGDVAEMALAHTVRDKVEASYRRGDMFGKRAQMMQHWADYCDKPSAGAVVPIRKRS